MPKADKFAVTNVAYIPAAPGTKLIVFSCPDYRTADPDDPKPIIRRAEHPIVCWEIRRSNLDDVWAAPVPCGIF